LEAATMAAMVRVNDMSVIRADGEP
jgi:hypothetical protein